MNSTKTTSAQSTITSFTWEVYPGARFSSMLAYYVTELKRTPKAVQLRCNESGRTHWVPLSWFKGTAGCVELKQFGARLLSEQGKTFVATEAFDL